MRSQALDVLLLAERTPPAVGGREVLLAELLRHQPPERTQLIAPATRGGTRFDASVPVPVRRRFPFVPQPLVPFATRKHLDWNVKRHPPGMVVAFGMFPEGTAALRLKRESGIPFVLHLDARALIAAKRDLRKGADRARRIQELLDESEAIITATRDCRLEAYRCGVLPHHIEVIPIGIDLKRFAPGAVDAGLAAKLGVKRGQTLITVAGEGGARDLETIFRAFSVVRGQVRGATLLVVGPVDGKRWKKTLHKLRIDRGVRFTDAVSPEHMPDHYRLADLYVSAHREDREALAVQGPDVAFAEALACGLPIVATRTAVGEELVPHEEGAGGLVEPGAHTKLAHAITELLQSSDRLREAKGVARDYAQAHHDGRASAHRFREFLEVIYYRRLRLGQLAPEPAGDEGSARPAA